MREDVPIFEYQNCAAEEGWNLAEVIVLVAPRRRHINRYMPLCAGVQTVPIESRNLEYNAAFESSADSKRSDTDFRAYRGHGSWVS